MIKSKITSKRRFKIINSISDVNEIPFEERDKIEKVTKIFGFKATNYYLSLIDWNDEDDGIRKIIIPTLDELEKWGEKDPSYEKKYTVSPGLQHKYSKTALFLIGPTCFGYCRFCFRKRLFMEDTDEIMIDVENSLKYIREHKEINNVLLTGGDPLVLSTKKLRKIIEAISEIEHISNIRIGTKALAFNPYRIIDDPDLIELFKKVHQRGKRLFVIAQFDHPKEINRISRKAVELLLKSGSLIYSQMPLLKGVNDDPYILSDLWEKLVNSGISPYYLFQCRPSVGNKPFVVPIERGFEIYEQAKMNCSGLSKKIRYVMSHASGKIEIAAMTKKYIVFKYHQAADPENLGRTVIYKRNEKAYWLDDYSELVDSYKVDSYFIES